jgi:valyl-tRNA synthetase
MIAAVPASAAGVAQTSKPSRLCTRLQALITAIRTIRSEMNVPPQKRAKVFIKAEDPRIAQLVHEYAVFFEELAQVSEVLVGPTIERPKNAPRMVLEWAEVFVSVRRAARSRTRAEALAPGADGSAGGARGDASQARQPRLSSSAPPMKSSRRRSARPKSSERRVERLEQNLAALARLVSARWTKPSRI